MPVARSTRQEPEAEREAAERSPLLLHSLSQFGELTRRSLEIVRPKSVVEIGGEGGKFTEMLLDFVGPETGTLVTIDPDPSSDLRRLAKQNPALRLLERPSPAALDAVERADLYLVDGDHNYAVVRAEMEKILSITTDKGTAALVILHDVGWPCARRDFYYDPDSLDPADVHPHSFTAGLVRETADLVQNRGHRGMGAMAIAETSGGERNGVLTAVEDALAERSGLDLLLVPVIFGIGFVFPTDAPWAEELRAFLAPFAESELLSTLESNRIALYLQLLDLQTEIERRTAQYNHHLGVVERQLGRPPEGEQRLADPDEVIR